MWFDNDEYKNNERVDRYKVTFESIRGEGTYSIKVKATGIVPAIELACKEAGFGDEPIKAEKI